MTQVVDYGVRRYVPFETIYEVVLDLSLDTSGVTRVGGIGGGDIIKAYITKGGVAIE